MTFHKERQDVHETPVNPTGESVVLVTCGWAAGPTEVDHLSVAANDKKPTTANSWSSKFIPQIPQLSGG